MKAKKSLLLLSFTLIMVFSLSAMQLSVFANNDNTITVLENEESADDTTTPKILDDLNVDVSQDANEVNITNENSQSDGDTTISGEPQKSNTLQGQEQKALTGDSEKYVVTADATGAEIARVEFLWEAIYQTMVAGGEEFTITLLANDDHSDIVAVLGYSYSPKKVTITSGKGGPFTIKKGPGTIEANRRHIAVSDNSEITLKNIILDGGNLYGGVLMNENTKLTLGEGATIQNCISIPHNEGGAVSLSKSNSTLVMKKGSSVINNKTVNSYGGGIYISTTSEFIVEGGTISGNISGSSGGGICSFGKATIQNGTITNNTAAASGANALGGGMYAGGSLVINNSDISNNAANPSEKTGYGGGIYANNTAEITDSKINNNTAYHGGGLYLSGKSTGTITGSEINDNTGSYAGGMYVSGNVKLTNSTVSANKGNQGGGIYLGGSAEGEIDNSGIHDNAASWGGGIFISNETASAILKNASAVTKNKVSRDGGGIYAKSYSYESPADTAKYQNMTIDDSVVFDGNLAEGGLYNPPSNIADFSNLKFAKTSVTGKGLVARDHLLNNYDINHKNEVLTVTYDANGGDGDNIVDEASSQSSYVIKDWEETDFTRMGYTLTGWNTSPDGSGEPFAPNDTVSITESMTLYAQWQINQYTVTYDSNGGDAIPSETVDYNGFFTKPLPPAKEGYTFVGWYLEESFANPYDFNTPVTKDLTLYAKWQKNTVTPTPTPTPPEPKTPPSPGVTKIAPKTPKTGDNAVAEIMAILMLVGATAAVGLAKRKFN